MARVNECPQNHIELKEAQNRLHCVNDKYGRNQYMCLPNVEKTSLVEFCYNGLMGIQVEGITFSQRRQIHT